MFIKDDGHKRHKQLCPLTVLALDADSSNVTVPSKSGCPMIAAMEDMRVSVNNGKLPLYVSESNDQFDNVLDKVLNHEHHITLFKTVI